MADISISTDLKLSQYEAWTEEMREHQRRILLARAYHDGNQPLALTDRQKKFLSLHTDTRFCLNICRIIVSSLADELTVIGFQTDEKAGTDKPQAKFFSEVWEKNKIDTFQAEVHEWAIRDSESFLVLGWDEETKLPKIVLHEAWTETDVNAWEISEAGVTADMVNDATGSGAGIYVKYKNNDPRQTMEFAIQYFYEDQVDDRGDLVSVHRRTIYTPGEINRQFMDDTGHWVNIAGEDAIQSWKANDGTPLGIPVIPFINKDGRQEAWDAIPPQDAINKTYGDVQGSSDLLGFPILTWFGSYPTTDGKSPAADLSNVIYIQPGAILGNGEKAPDEIAIDKIEGSDPTPLVNFLKDQIMFAAQITGTPVNKFITTAQVASEKTLKEQKESLKTRAKNRQTSFGDSWEQVMKLSRRIYNAFGNNKLDETVKVKTVWKNIEDIETLKEEQALGVPLESILSRLGYTEDQIQTIRKSPAYRIQLMKAFWEAYNSAKENGVTVAEFCKAIGLSEEETALIVPANPSTDNGNGGGSVG